MAAIALVIDPSGSSLTLTNSANGWRLLGLDMPVPDVDAQWASSADTEGERRASGRHRNRTITAKILIERSTDALLETQENLLGSKIGKLGREGGDLQVTVPSGTVVTFTVEDATFNRTWDPMTAATHRAFYDVVFTCKPYGVGTEVELGSDTVEATLPYLVKTVTGPVGDVPALGRLLIDNDQAVDQWWLTWGIQSRYYDAGASAALFFEAEGRTAMGGSAAAAGPSGASGAGSNVMRNTALSTDYLAILSTQATGAGAHLSHIGTFRVYARVQVPTTNTGLVSVALEWAEADFLRYTRNSATTIPAEHEGRWRYVDLGLVTTTKVISGTQRWEGRIVAKSTVASDDIDVDYLLLIPADEGSGIVSGVSRPYTPTAYVGEDRFTSTTAGNALNARAAPTGGTWATSGDATDYAFADDLSGEQLKRSTVSGTNGRFAVLGSTNYAGVIVSSKITHDSSASSGFPQSGVIARWTDASNHLRAVIYRDSSGSAPFEAYLEIHELLAGTKTVVAQEISADSGGVFNNNLWNLTLTVEVSGQVTAQMVSAGVGAGGGGTGLLSVGTVLLSATASLSSAATGATLATGKPGLFDLQTSASPTVNRYYDDFLVASIPADATAFASQSVELRHDRVVREDSGGTMWTKPSSYVGDYLLIPPTGQEARSSRVIVKMARSDPFVLDPAIDDLSARLFATPRFLAIPD